MTHTYTSDAKLLARAQRLLPRPGESLEAWAKRVSGALKLLSLNNQKLLKGDGIEAALMLAPHSLSGYNVCEDSTAGCREACVAHAGNGRFSSVLAGRIKRTRRFFQDRGGFAVDLAEDLRLLHVMAQALSLNLAVRLNVFSDLPWERIKLYDDGLTALDLCERWGIQAYDYTKSRKRAEEARRGRYHLTYSRSEATPDAEVVELVSAGVNVAVPFHPRPPAKWQGLRVIDGDQTDQRYRDPRGVVVGLKAKGTGRSDASGFVVRLEQ